MWTLATLSVDFFLVKQSWVVLKQISRLQWKPPVVESDPSLHKNPQDRLPSYLDDGKTPQSLQDYLLDALAPKSNEKKGTEMDGKIKASMISKHFFLGGL